jgi:hypothetical protein
VNLRNTRTIPGSKDSAVVENAVEALESLRWSTEATSTAKTSFAAAKLFVGLEDTDSSTRKERDWSRPERIAELISFIRRHLTLSRQSTDASQGSRRIAIAVDELDKLSNPDEILETINSLKDLFRIPQVHFLVSVSSDAMVRFALRGIASRDAFDSSFDAVIELRRLTATESHDILSARAIGFPRSLSAISHAWSGGLPRDLIRVARWCVELRRNTGITSIDQLSASIIAEDMAQTLMALRETENLARADEDRSVPSQLTSLINDLIRSREVHPTSSELSTLLLTHASVCSSLPPIVRAPTTKLLVGGVLTMALTGAVARGRRTIDDETAFVLADELANVIALQSEPLGEMLGAASEMLSHMKRLEITVPIDIWPLMEHENSDSRRNSRSNAVVLAVRRFIQR